jgi:hypothetical protein
MSIWFRTLLAAAAAGLTAGCAGSLSQGSTQALPANVFQVAPPPGVPIDVHARPAPKSATAGIYVAEYSSSYVYGYPIRNSKNHPATCSIYDPNGSVNNLGVDASGDLIIPNGNPYEILVYKGTKLCGPFVSEVTEPYGQPAGAASNDALNGTIAVDNIFDVASYNGGAGSITLCTLSGGCTVNLTNPGLYAVGGVAMDKHGNCWASGDNKSYSSALIYFAGCTGPGVAATGIAQTYGFAGLDIDKDGNLVTISVPASLYVYSGCKPKCKLIGGPFALEGDSTFGHLNKNSTSYAVGDYQYGQVDIYSYSPTAVTYKYSFNNGLSTSATVGGAAYSPRSSE